MDVDTARKGVLLGNAGVEGEVWHCCITSLAFEKMIDGELLSGWDVRRRTGMEIGGYQDRVYIRLCFVSSEEYSSKTCSAATNICPHHRIQPP